MPKWRAMQFDIKQIFKPHIWNLCTSLAKDVLGWMLQPFQWM
jgi:hypothetical protein